ncbi:MAG TPA: hypothetical protein VGG19_07470 [Tepidisphaeraceae bacterium]
MHAYSDYTSQLKWQRRKGAGTIAANDDTIAAGFMASKRTYASDHDD